VKRVHRMPFGAALEDGGTRFRLWAPAARSVELLLARVGGAERPVAMHACGDGWCEALVRDSGAGDRYRYRIDGGISVPDPASRFNPLDVHGPSEVIDPGAFDWTDDDWRGRPWSEAVVYELHVGTFSGSGTFDGVIDKLDHLVSLGATALELMPVADFPGRRGWGYDGVLPFAPEAGYGRPDDLKRLVCAAHAKGLMVLLDVVYNHFGPDGNYLHAYAPQFFTERHRTPWGAAINFDGDDSHWVRRFFVDNAAYWIEEYHLDGLRFDAVHAIVDDSRPHLLEEIAGAIREGPGRDRHVHLVLENDANQARYLGLGSDGRQLHDAQWNDDLHHALHVTLTGESDGYYADYASDPVGMLGRCLAEGFAFQGEASPFRDGERRGEPSAHLPSTAFVGFLQNHDQVGNRAFGERIAALAQESALRAGTELLLLAPAVPMLFMGEEFGAATPFQYFCDFTGELAEAVTTGRRGEFAKFEKFSAPEVAESIPDPNAESTFAASRLDWASLGRDPHAGWLDLYRRLLSVRRESIVPRLAVGPAHGDGYRKIGRRGLEVRWRLADGSRLRVVANLGDQPIEVDAATAATGAESIYATPGAVDRSAPSLPPWSVRWSIEA
jgi:maltooligosyltrehalose trehalohydrolase